MAGETTPAAGASAEIDYSKLRDAIAPLVQSAVADATKPLQDRLDKLQSPPPAETSKEADKPKAVTLDDVSKLLDTKLQAQQTSSQRTAERQAYQADKLKDLPAVYRDRLGNDPAKWASEEQQIRDTFKGDLKAHGVTPHTVGNQNPAGQPPSAPIDMSKLNPVQKIGLGLKASKPQMNAGANATADANAAAATAAQQQQAAK